MVKKTVRKPKKVSVRKKKPAIRWKSLILKLITTGIVLLIAVAIYLDAIVIRQFEGKKWAIPAKVYARSVELYDGKMLTAEQLQTQLKRQGYQAVRQVSRPGTFSRTGDRFTIYSRGFHFPDGAESSRLANVQFSGQQVASVKDRRDAVLPLLRLDPQPIGGIYPSSYEDRLLIRLDQTPKYLLPALLAIEDRNYYEHYGVSPGSIARAMVVNFKAGGVVQGGSTLTQQLVKNFYLSNERSFIRKGKEAIMALLLEFHYSKDEILETYLNEVYLGQQGRRAIHGFGLASQFYFAQPIQELNLARTALLVAIVKGPSYYGPRRYSERALERRNLVLDVLADQGVVPRVEAERSKKLPLGIVSREQVKTNAFPAYIDLVKKQLRQDYDDSDLTSEGLRIFTNLDPIIQRQAQSSLSRTVDILDKAGQLQGAMVVTSAQTGDLLALVGDRNPGFDGFNRAVEARRPVGSLLKPAIYLTALEHPDRFTLTTPVNDSSVKISDGKGGFWEPKNYSKKSHGPVPLYLALSKSYNQAAANTGMAVGLRNVIQTAERLGISSSMPSYPSVLLGAVSLAPIEIANMYQTIASAGFRMPIRAIDAVVDARGQSLKRYSLSVEQVVDAAPMELLRYSMIHTMKEGTGRRAYQSIDKSIRLAGKSGTTNDLRDSWFAGFSGNLMTVVWLGKDDNSPTTLTGSSGALRVWSRFMSAMPLQSIKSVRSDQLEYQWVDPAANKRSHQYCSGAEELPYIKGSIPGEYGGCQSEGGKPSLIDKIRDWFQ